MTQPSAQGKRSEEKEKSFWGSFNRADGKVFLITLARTLAANIVTLLVVAGTIILAAASTRVGSESSHGLSSSSSLLSRQPQE